MCVAIVTVALWASGTGLRLRLPYAVSLGGLVLAGSLSALTSASPMTGAVTLFQELFLLAWCIAVANVARTPRGLAVIVRTWCWSATLWAAFAVGAVLTHHYALAGVNSATGGRLELTFDQPNMAASYFYISLFLILAARCPRPPFMRLAAGLVVFGALVLAGSNAALLGLPATGAVVALLSLRRRIGIVPALATVLLSLLVVGAFGAVTKDRVTEAVHSSRNPLIKYSVARSSRSAAARQSLFSAEYGLFRDGPVQGRGPAATRSALGASTATTVKEAHNDYLATLVERGPLGAIALMLLVGAIGVRGARVEREGLSAGFAQVVPATPALMGALVAMAISAGAHEVLHYRHFWALLGILAGLYMFGQETASEGSSR